MRKILFLLLSLGMTQLCLADKQKKADAETDKFRYDIEYARPSGDGICQVKVWSYSKKSRIAAEQCRKNAVHGIIFKSYSTGEGTAASQRPLVKNPAVQTEKAEFFDEFFSDGGSYRQFVSAITDGSQQIVKVGKQYKVGVVVTVSKDQLRKYLETEGVIRSLSSGF